MRVRRIILMVVVAIVIGCNGMLADRGEVIRLKIDSLEMMPYNKELIKEIGYLYMEQGDYNRSKEMGNRLLQLAAKDSDEAFAGLYGHILLGSSTLGDTDPLIPYKHLEEALLIAQRTNNTVALVSIHNSLGIYYNGRSFNEHKAMDNYFKALEYAKANGDKRRYAIILSNISATFFSKEDEDCALYAQEAYDEAVQNQEIIPQFYSAFVLAYNYLRQKDFIKAKKYIHIVEELIDEVGYYDHATVHEFYANLYLEQGNIDGAIREASKALNHDSIVEVHPLVHRYRLYAEIMNAAKDYKKAIIALDSAQAISARHALDNYKGEISKEKSETFQMMNRLDSALYYSHIYQAYMDSVYTANSEVSLQESRIKNDIHLRDKKIDQQQIQILNYRYRSLILIGSLLLVIIVAVLSIVSYYRKSQLYKAIVRQNQESIKREQILHKSISELQAKVASNDAAPLEEAAAGPEEKDEEASPIDRSKSEKLVTRFTDMMLQKRYYLDSSLTITAMSDYLGTNRTYLSKAINDCLGQSFTQVVNGYRVRHAIKLISDTEANLPLKVVSSDSGFNSLSTFYTTFQQEIGLTPAKYRAQLK